MLNTVSVVVGIVALIGAAVGFLPFLGWLNWLVIPLGVVGLAVGLLASNRAGRNLNLLVLIVASVRLMIGGGVF